MHHRDTLSRIRNFRIVPAKDKQPRKHGHFGFTDDLDELFSPKRDALFLNHFTRDGLLKIIDRTGLPQHLAKTGFRDIRITSHTDETSIHYLRIFNREETFENLLVDLRLSETRFMPDANYFPRGATIAPYDMVVIEWLSAQNPYAGFWRNKPQLPGQTKPGLGALPFCFDIMKIIARTMYKDGFLDVPDHMHGAIMYSSIMKFFDPVHEGILRAIRRDMRKYSLVDLSWGMITGTIIENYKNQPQAYEPSEQIFPISRRMRDYFNSRRYRIISDKYYRRKRYRFEYERMCSLREEMLKTRKIEDL